MTAGCERCTPNTHEPCCPANGAQECRFDMFVSTQTAFAPHLIIPRALRQEVGLAAEAPAVQQRLDAARVLDLGQHARVDAVKYARNACAWSGGLSAGAHAFRPAHLLQQCATSII